MAKKVYARRYAQAVFEIALKSGKLEQWQADLRRIAGVVADPAVLAWLESPKVHFEDKTRVLAQGLSSMGPLALNLMRLLVDRGVPGITGDIADEYQRLVDKHNGIERAEVVTAVALSDADRQKLAQKLGAMVGKKVQIEPHVDPTVLGGIIARIDGKLLDASSRSKLEALRKVIGGAGGKAPGLAKEAS